MTMTGRLLCFSVALVKRNDESQAWEHASYSYPQSLKFYKQRVAPETNKEKQRVLFLGVVHYPHVKNDIE